MKKHVFSILLFFCLLISIPGISQEKDTVCMNRKGKIVMPEKGDFAVGMDAILFLLNVSDFLKYNEFAEMPILFMDNSYYAKYMINKNIAFRLSFSGELTSQTQIILFESDLNPDLTVEDIRTYRNNSLLFSPGVQYSRGNNWVQVFCGAELVFSYSSSKIVLEYGNEFSSENTSPTTTVAGFYAEYDLGKVDERLVTLKKSPEMEIGTRAFAGLEYFIFPKFSISFEAGLTYSFNRTSDRIATSEYWDFNKNMRAFKTEQRKGSWESGFSVDFMHLLVLMYYF